MLTTESIIKFSKWVKACPSCGQGMQYSTNQSYNKSLRLNISCRSCKRATKVNYTGKKIGKLRIDKQYMGIRNNGQKLMLVDYTCDCGTVLTGAYLQNVKLQNGCRKCQKRGVTKLGYGDAAFNILHNQYVQNAKLRGHCFELTKAEFRILTKQNCFYCNSIPKTVMDPNRCNGKYVYNGVDRKDNSKGYTLENSVSCCKFCNLTKNATGFNDFISWIRTVYENTKNISLE